MGSVKNHDLEESYRKYRRNQYNHEAQKLRERMRTYANRPGFVAKLKRELEELKAWRKAELAEEKRIKQEC